MEESVSGLDARLFEVEFMLDWISTQSTEECWFFRSFAPYVTFVVYDQLLVGTPSSQMSHLLYTVSLLTVVDTWV